jgi:hypothetical protein
MIPAIKINWTDGATPALRERAEALEHPAVLTKLLTRRMEYEVRENFIRKDGEPKKGTLSKGFTHKKNFFITDGANVTSVTETTETRGVVTVASRKMALRFHGGTVSRKLQKALTLPLTDVAYQQESARLWKGPGELEVIPDADDNDETVGFLAVRNADGTLTRHYLLVTSADIPKDPTVLPSVETLRKGMDEEASDYFGRLERKAVPPETITFPEGGAV